MTTGGIDNGTSYPNMLSRSGDLRRVGLLTNYPPAPGCYWLHRKMRKWTRRVAARHPVEIRQISEIQSVMRAP